MCKSYISTFVYDVFSIFKSKSYLNFSGGKMVYLKDSVDIIEHLCGRTKLNHYISYHILIKIPAGQET